MPRSPLSPLAPVSRALPLGALLALAAAACGGKDLALTADGPSDTRASSSSTHAASSASTSAPTSTTRPMGSTSSTSTASTSPTCGPDAWCWESPKPQGNPLGSVWISGKGDGWAAGDAGTLLRLGPTGWTLQASPTNLSIGGLWGAASDDVWAYANPTENGVRGVLLHWNGSLWESSQPGDTGYTDISGSAADDVWALSWNDHGLYPIHWTGSAWSHAPLPPAGFTLGSLCVRGKDDVWATASEASVASDDTFVLHWTGGSWEQSDAVNEPSRFDEGLACGPGTDVWVPVYDFDTQLRSARRWDGTRWQDASFPSAIEDGWADVESLRAAHDGTLILIDSSLNKVFRLTGTTWSSITPVVKAPLSLRLGGLDFAPDGTAWLTSTSGDLVPWTGSAWDTAGVVEREPVLSLVGVRGGPPTLAVDQSGGTGRRVADGGEPAWSFAPSPKPLLTGVAAAIGPGPSDVWFAAGGDAVHLTADRRTTFVLTTAQLIAFSATSPDDVWAIDAAAALFRWNGSAWSAVAPGFPTMFAADRTLAPSGIFVAADDDVWVSANARAYIGGGAVIAHWDGTAWTAAWLGQEDATYASAIAGSSASGVWIAGSSLWHLDGSTWDALAGFASDGAVALAVSTQGVYVLTEQAYPQSVIRWEPQERLWSTFPLPLSQDVGAFALYVGSAALPAGDAGADAAIDGQIDTIWVAGDNAAVLSLTPPVLPRSPG